MKALNSIAQERGKGGTQRKAESISGAAKGNIA